MSSTVKSLPSGVAAQCQMISSISRAVSSSFKLATFGGGAPAPPTIGSRRSSSGTAIADLSGSGRAGLGPDVACFSAVSVWGPTLPSTTRPFPPWKARTEVSVSPSNFRLHRDGEMRRQHSAGVGLPSRQHTFAAVFDHGCHVQESSVFGSAIRRIRRGGRASANRLAGDATLTNAAGCSSGWLQQVRWRYRLNDRLRPTSGRKGVSGRTAIATWSRLL